MQEIELSFELDPIERLEKEIEIEDDSQRVVIGQYLKSRFESDEVLRNAYKDKKRTLRDVYKYVIDCARNLAPNGYGVMVEDKDVYGWAVHYILDGKQEHTTKTYKLTKEEKKSIEEQAKERYMNEVLAKLKAEDEEKKKKEEEKKAKELAKFNKKKEEEGAISLFDL